MAPISLVDRVRRQAQLGQFSRAERLIRRIAGAAAREQRGSELAESVAVLSAAYQEANRLEDAAHLLDWAIEADVATGTAERGTLMRSLGELQIDLGRLEAAHRTLAAAIKIHRSALGDEHEETVRDLLSQADLDRAAGHPDRANRKYRELVEQLEQRAGPRSARLIEPLQAWVDLLLDSDLPHEQACVPAEKHLRRLLELQDAAEPNGPEAGWTRLDLADLLHDHERCEEALEMAKPAWERGRVHATDDPELFDRATQWLAGWYQAHDQPSDAVELLGQSLRVWQFLTGPAHPKVAQALGALAQAHLHAEHLQEADQLCERGLDILSSLLGDMPRASEFVQFSADDLAVARMSFASLLWTRGAVALRQDNALAVAFFGGRALLLLDLNDDEVGETLRPTLCTARAEVLRLLGHAATTDAEAEALFHRAMDQARTGEGDVLPSTLEDYADWLQAHGRPAEADQTRKDVDAWWEVNG